MNKNEEQVLRQALSRLNEEVPPMPEGLHERWMTCVKEDAAVRKTTKARSWTRILSVAAALVFVVGGTLLTREDLAQQVQQTAEGNGSISQASSRVTASPKTAAGARLMSNMSYDLGASASSENGYGISAPMLARGADVDYKEDMVLAESASSEDTAARKIIRRASLSLRTAAYDTARSALTELITSQGGWWDSLSEYDADDGRTLYLTARIPAEQLDAFLTQSGSLAQVRSLNTSFSDRTEAYQDTSARLENEKAIAARLTELLTQAQDIEDILAIESKLTDVQYTIEQYERSLMRTDNQAQYATVDITLSETLEPDLTDTTLTFSQRLRGALTVGAHAFLSFLSDIAVFLVSALPFIGIAAGVALVALFIRHIRRRN